MLHGGMHPLINVLAGRLIFSRRLFFLSDSKHTVEEEKDVLVLWEEVHLVISQGTVPTKVTHAPKLRSKTV